MLRDRSTAVSHLSHKPEFALTIKRAFLWVRGQPVPHKPPAAQWQGRR